jgi:hypothetical protein
MVECYSDTIEVVGSTPTKSTGVCGATVHQQDCGSCVCGFESRQSPQLVSSSNGTGHMNTNHEMGVRFALRLLFVIQKESLFINFTQKRFLLNDKKSNNIFL